MPTFVSASLHVWLETGFPWQLQPKLAVLGMNVVLSVPQKLYSFQVSHELHCFKKKKKGPELIRHARLLQHWPQTHLKKIYLERLFQAKLYSQSLVLTVVKDYTDCMWHQSKGGEWRKSSFLVQDILILF